MSEKVLHSPEIAPGEYKDLFEFLIKESKIFKTKFFIFHKHVETGESAQYGVRYYEKQYQQQILELFEKNDFEGILALPVGEYGRCATQLVSRYVESGKVVGFQIDEARPHEDGRTVGLTPAKVFLEEEGKKLVEIAKQVDQES
ncbi:MAG: hypothetical protein AAF518_06030 [Spirochaetota bacterium]